MPITADLDNKNYVLGRGKVFVDRYAPNAIINALTQGLGERYIGNTPEFSTNSTSENLDHYDSDAGVRTKDASVQLSFDRAGTFTCDNVNLDNVGMYFLADGTQTITQAAVTGATTTVKVRKGLFYQMGATTLTPSGVRRISNVVATKAPPGGGAGIAVPALANYEVDEELGRIYTEVAATGFDDDDVLTFTYDVAATTRDQVVSKNQPIYCAIRFVADNAYGQNRDFYFPYVKLAPDGDYNLKGDDWQTMSFTMEILKKASNIESCYIDGRPTAGV